MPWLSSVIESIQWAHTSCIFSSLLLHFLIYLSSDQNTFPFCPTLLLILNKSFLSLFSYYGRFSLCGLGIMCEDLRSRRHACRCFTLLLLFFFFFIWAAFFFFLSFSTACPFLAVKTLVLIIYSYKCVGLGREDRVKKDPFYTFF